MITAIKIDEENFKHYSLVKSEEEENQGYLDNLSKINIFIGENNSGKSRFMRVLFSDKKLAYKDNMFLEKINEIHDSFSKKIDTYFNVRKVSLPNDLEKFLPKKVNIISKNYNDAILSEYVRNLTTYFQSVPLEYPNDFNRGLFIERIEKHYYEQKENLDVILKSINNFSEAHIYIPMLRGLRTYENLLKDYNADENNYRYTHFETDVYKWRTKKDYFKESDEKINDRIFTGLGLYEDCKNLLLGAKEDRDKIRNFEEFLSECFFDGKDVNLIPSIKDDVLHVRIGKQEFPVSQLGDGIQSVIILTYPLFFNQGEHMLFFFEEPEQCLHPAYQRVFMETLMRKEFDTFQYFFTTHSNHLLDITLEIDKVSIYTFKKTNDSMDNPTFEIENVDNENTDILRLIGVRNSSVFLSNCTIWVEGITDRIYIRKYLEVYQKTQKVTFLEDIHYSFVEYGGGNITHWSFLEDADPNHKNILVDRLCGKLFLISDQDGAGNLTGTKQEKEKKKLRHEKLKAKLGDDHYYCLEAREIENLIDTDVLEKVIKSYEGKNKTNLKFKANFKYQNYKDKPIGKFIDANITDSTRKGGYAAASGTITGSKFEFAKRAVKEINSINNLSDEAKLLAEKLYEFIKDKN